jgi:hypothetical protein
MRAAAALLALPAVLALTAQTPAPHPLPSGASHAHHPGRDGRPDVIVVTGVSVAPTPKPARAKPTPTPMGDPQVFETHSSTDAR